MIIGKGRDRMKVLMVDYYGACDTEGKATGHSPKVAKEYRGLFSEEEQVDIAVSPCIADEVYSAGFSHIFKLPYNIIAADYNRFSKRILDKFKILINIRHVFQISGYDLVWFYRIDFFLLLYIIFTRKTVYKRICLIYHMGIGRGIIGRLIDWVYNSGLRKFDGVIYTQAKMKIPVEYKFYMPDYLYKKESYGRYATLAKGRKAVCLGAMNPYKKLEELVDVFNECGYPLEIVGHFFDKERAAQLKKKAKKNIYIEDRILDEIEYYEKLGSARYSVLPYDMDQYKNRTSGILLECTFLGVVPVAPEALLQENALPGIGYTSINEIGMKIEENLDLKMIYANQEKVRLNFDEDHIRYEFREWLSGVDGDKNHSVI